MQGWEKKRWLECDLWLESAVIHLLNGVCLPLTNKSFPDEKTNLITKEFIQQAVMVNKLTPISYINDNDEKRICYKPKEVIEWASGKNFPYFPFTLADIEPVVEPTQNEEKPLGNMERDNLLKLIGGLVMKGYGIDIHADRIEGAKQIIDDLSLIGVKICERTLRDRLKQAADLIKKP